MTTNIYVDGSGGTKSGYGFFVKETGESFFEEKPGITNNQACLLYTSPSPRD